MGTKKNQLKTQLSYSVTQSNELISKLRVPFTLNQQKLVLLAISMIKPTDKEFQRYTISVADFCRLTGTAKNAFYNDFKELVLDLKRRQADSSRWITDGDIEFPSQWFSEIDYIPRTGAIRMMFDSHLMPHLLNLSRNFTRYELWCILRMRGKYSIRLYQLFKRDAFDKSSVTLRYSLEFLKDALIANTYGKYKDFRVRVIDPAIEEINECSDIKVTYDKIKSGKQVTEIEFTIEKKDKDAAYQAYVKVLEQINKDQKQIPGQMSLFDNTADDFADDIKIDVNLPLNIT